MYYSPTPIKHLCVFIYLWFVSWLGVMSVTLWRYESDTITSAEIRVEQSAETSREAPVSVLIRGGKKYELPKPCKNGDYIRIEGQKVVQCKSLEIIAGDSVGSSWFLAILLCFVGLAWALYEYEYIQEEMEE